MKKQFLFLLFACLITLSVTAQHHSRKYNANSTLYTDIVYLKDGSVIYGTITEYNLEGHLSIISVDGSSFIFPSKSIKNIVKGNANTGRRNTRAYYGLLNTKTLGRGYKGFVEAGYEHSFGKFEGGIFTLSTSHGFQFNPYFYLGGGIAFNFYTYTADDETYGFLPVYINLRTNLTASRVSPYLDIKTGVVMNEDGGFYASPSLGVRIGLRRKLGLNISINYTYQDVYVAYNYGTYTQDSRRAISSVGMKFGLDF